MKHLHWVPKTLWKWLTVCYGTWPSRNALSFPRENGDFSIVINSYVTVYQRVCVRPASMVSAKCFVLNNPNYSWLVTIHKPLYNTPINIPTSIVKSSYLSQIQSKFIWDAIKPNIPISQLKYPNIEPLYKHGSLKSQLPWLQVFFSIKLHPGILGAPRMPPASTFKWLGFRAMPLVGLRLPETLKHSLWISEVAFFFMENSNKWS